MDGRCPLSRHLAGNELDISHFVQIRTSLVFLTLSVESIRSQAHSVGSPGTGDRLRLPPSRSVSQGTSRQDSRVQKMNNPAQISTYIKEQQKMALAGVRGHQPLQALLSFCASMEHLCSVAQPFLNYINLSAIITATAQLWTTARAKSSFQPSANMAGFDLKQFYSSILLQLEPMLPDVGAQAVSNILWSSAKLGLNPDAFVPGMTDALAATMLQLTKDKAGCQPNAQQCANFLWAFASMGHQPADKGLIDAVCQHFVRLIKHRDVSKRPNAQSAANLLWALASLGHQPADKGLVDAVSECFVRLIKHHDVSKQPNAQEAANLIWALASLGHQRADKGLIDAVCEHFVRLVKHHDISKRPNAQGAANLLWALASLGHQPEDKGLIDAVCNHFVRLIKHHDVSKRPNAQGAANVIWALGELNHEPPDGAASAILERLSVLCGLPRQAPNAQELSNTLLACAVLHLKVKDHVSLALVDGLLRLDRAHCSDQTYCNAAWSLAVLDKLCVDLFSLILGRLRPLSTEPAHNALPKQGLHQLYQALDFLQPLSTAAAQQLQEMMTRLGPRPLPDKRSAAYLCTSKHLCAALEQLGLAFTANVPLSGYWADAVLQPQDGVAAPVVLVPESYSGRFSNQEKRLTGRAVFRRALLAKQGKLVLIPEQELSRSLGDLADYIQQQVEDVTGDSLKPYIMS
ncbi:TPA: hypothetical protein ACH3X2_000175 [Trebouxia sp. C0005]